MRSLAASAGGPGSEGLTFRGRTGRLPFVNAYRPAVDPLEALGDATRRAIVEGLRGGERTVGDLASSLPVSRPAVSQHLGVLRAAGLVLERPQGTRRWYRLDPIGLVRLQARLDTMWGLDAETAAGSVPVPPTEPAARPAEGTAQAPVVAAPAPQPAPEAEAPAKGGRKKRKKKGGRK
jgi:DNA-binding transcriptional ArsR family regulator